MVDLKTPHAVREHTGGGSVCGYIPEIYSGVPWSINFSRETVDDGQEPVSAHLALNPGLKAVDPDEARIPDPISANTIPVRGHNHQIRSAAPELGSGGI